MGALEKGNYWRLLFSHPDSASVKAVAVPSSLFRRELVIIPLRQDTVNSVVDCVLFVSWLKVRHCWCVVKFVSFWHLLWVCSLAPAPHDVLCLCSPCFMACFLSLKSSLPMFLMLPFWLLPEVEVYTFFVLLRLLWFGWKMQELVVLLLHVLPKKWQMKGLRR